MTVSDQRIQKKQLLKDYVAFVLRVLLEDLTYLRLSATEEMY